MNAERPHVTTKDEALRNVDVFHDFISEEELNSFLITCELIGVGTNAIVFLLPSPDNCGPSETLFRLEIQNPVGYEWTKILLQNLCRKYPSFFEKIKKLLQKLEERVKPRSLQTQIHESKRSIKKQIAGHNAAFRRDPLLTMPINCFYTFKGKWLGIRMKYLNGVSLKEAFPHAQLTSYTHAILKDENPSNVLIGITNSQVEEALIDIWDFTPSNQEIEAIPKEHLYEGLD